jgi:hypothetical protein
MTRRSRITLAVLLLMLAGAAPSSRLSAQEPPAPPPARTPDPLDVFVPHEKVDADSIVAFPVDI